MRLLPRSSLLRLAIIFATTDILIVFLYLLGSYFLIREHPITHPADTALLFYEDFGPYDGVSAGTLKRIDQAQSLLLSNQIKNVICLGGGELFY